MRVFMENTVFIRDSQIIGDNDTVLLQTYFNVQILKSLC